MPSCARLRPSCVVLGFDGADAKLTEQYMAEGKLPNLARLAKQGGYARLTPTAPACSMRLRMPSMSSRRGQGCEPFKAVQARQPIQSLLIILEVATGSFTGQGRVHSEQLLQALVKLLEGDLDLLRQAQPFGFAGLNIAALGMGVSPVLEGVHHGHVGPEEKHPLQHVAPCPRCLFIGIESAQTRGEIRRRKQFHPHRGHMTGLLRNLSRF